jgi:DNA-binding CsgD family transcriptional regulator
MKDAHIYALPQPESRREKPLAPTVRYGAPLTPREMQVALLVAGGCSNKEIAAEMVISQRNAEGTWAHPGRARLHVPRPGSRLGRVTTRR